MPQQNLCTTHGSPKVLSESPRQEANKISKPFPIAHEGKDGMAPQPLDASDQVPMSSMGQTRETRFSSASASRRQTYATVSSHNPQDSVSTSASRESTVQRRRGSALKNVMRKIFARKRQSQLDEGEGDGELFSRNIRTEKGDDETGANRATFSVHGSPSSRRTASTENKHSSVGSHPSSSPSDHLVRSGQGPSPPVPQPVPRRRATLPNLVVSDEDARDTALSIVTASSTRPSTAVSDEPQRSFDVGSRTSMQLHRRSQSADALRELVQRHRMSPIQWRRRSDEKKFWRTSILDLDPPVRPQTSVTTTTETAAITEEKPMHGSENGDSAPPAGPEEAPFDFGNLIGAMQDTDVPLEQRVTTLEVKLMDLEFAIAKIQGTTPNGFPGATPDRTPKKGTASGEQHHITSGASEGSSENSLSPITGGRPISTVTLRPNMVYSQPPPWQTPSSSTTNLDGISIEQYTALVTLIRREQTARRALEEQVSQLQEEMRRFRADSVLLGSSPGTYYPIPSPDPQDPGEVRLHVMSPLSPRKQDFQSRGSERESDGNRYDSRHWDIYCRSNADVAPRTMAGML